VAGGNSIGKSTELFIILILFLFFEYIYLSISGLVLEEVVEILILLVDLLIYFLGLLRALILSQLTEVFCYLVLILFFIVLEVIYIPKAVTLSNVGYMVFQISLEGETVFQVKELH
jgi:hypothetical protein